MGIRSGSCLAEKNLDLIFSVCHVESIPIDANSRGLEERIFIGSLYAVVHEKWGPAIESPVARHVCSVGFPDKAVTSDELVVRAGIDGENLSRPGVWSE